MSGAQLTKLQAETLALVAAGNVVMHRHGYGAWRIHGATPSVVGRLISMGLVTWGPFQGDERHSSLTDAGRALLEARS